MQGKVARGKTSKLLRSHRSQETCRNGWRRMAPGTELGDPFIDRNLVIPRLFFVSSPKLFSEFDGVVYIAMSHFPS
jgi:hypothetical protein